MKYLVLEPFIETSRISIIMGDSRRGFLWNAPILSNRKFIRFFKIFLFVHKFFVKIKRN